MPTLKEIYKAFDEFAPFDTALGFDNAGLLVERIGEDITTAAVCLDITADTVKQAVSIGAQLIVSHHPVIFTPQKRLETSSPSYMLAAENIAALCVHTNLDAANGGVNDCLADALGMTDTVAMDGGDAPYPPICRVGNVPEMTADRFAAYVKERLGCGGVKYVPCSHSIKRVAVCGGAGEEYITAAVENGCDAFVTGESKHHLNLLAKQNDIGMYICGHFVTEHIVKAAIANLLNSRFDSLKVVILDESDPAKYL